MTYRILNIELLFSGNVKWYLRDSEGRKLSYITELPIDDYFFVTEEMVDDLKKLYPTVDFVFETTKNHVFEQFKHKDKVPIKVSLKNPYMKNKIRIKMEEEYNHLIYEADIKYIDLIMKDLDINAYVDIVDGKIVPVDKPDDFLPLRICYYDIETDDRPETLKNSKIEEFAKIDTARILSASICDHDSGEIKHFVHDDENVLLQEIANELSKYDVIQAWNGNHFDFLYFKRFSNVNGFNPNMFILLDAMKIHEMLNPKEREYVSLDMAGQRYLDIRKIQHTWSFYDAWKNHRDELKVYNDRDVELMKKLEDKFGYAGIVLQTAEKIGFLPQKYTYSRYSSICAIMKISLDHYNKRVVWKSKSEIPIDEAYEGAMVFDSIKGVHKNVVGIDLASLYNNIIQTYNISPEQLVIYKDGSHDYSRFDHEGIMPRALRMFETDREEYKTLRNQTTDTVKYKLYDQIQSGLKVILLSIYGGLGARGSTRAKASGKPSGAKSFYNYYCANDTTKYAREIIILAKDVVERIGYKVVYGDTDSLYIFIGDDDYNVEEVKNILNNIVDEVNKDYFFMLEKDNIPVERRKIRMEAQGWYSPFVLFGKKKYYFAKEIYNAENNKLNEELVVYAKGIKMIKLSEPIFIRDFQKTIYTMVLEYKSFDYINDYIIDTRSKFYNGDFDSKLVFETNLSKPISEYTTKPPHVVLAEKLIRQGKMQEKSTLFYVIDRLENRKPHAAIEGSPIMWQGRNYVWEYRIQKWLDEIINLVFFESKQTNIDNWFI